MDPRADAGNTRPHTRSLEIPQLRTCRCAEQCTLRQWLKSLMAPEGTKRPVLQGCHPVQLAKLERKMDQDTFHTTILDFVFVVNQRGRPPAGQVTEVQGGSLGSAQHASVSLSTKPISDFEIWLLTTCPRLQLLLALLCLLQDLLLLLVHHFIILYLYSQKLNTILLFFLECRFLGGITDAWKPLAFLGRDVQSWEKGPVIILLSLQGGAYTCALNFIIILFKDE